MITGKILWMVKEGKLPCLFHEFTGFYCPGCGGTRAVKALLSGHPLISFLYHPLILYCVLAALWLSVSYIRGNFFGEISCDTKDTAGPGLHDGYVYAGIAIILINFIVKNYLLAVKGIDVLALLPDM